MTNEYSQYREPGFLIIGCQKGGTSSLYANLTRNPYIRPAGGKEIHFFDDNYHQGLNWYRLHFPPVGLFDETLSGEASPYYFFHPAVPRRLFQTYPRIKLILLLRNPVDRAYSHYQHNIRKKREIASFPEAIAREPHMLEGEEEKLLRINHYKSINHKYFSYLSRGVYIKQLKRWTTYFPLDRFKIIKSEDYFQTPLQVVEEVIRFLGVKQHTAPSDRAKNLKTGSRHKYPPMSQEMRRKLTDYFKPHNHELYHFLNWNFGWEKESKK